NQQAAFLRDRELGRALARMFTAYLTEELQHYREQGDGAPASVTTRLMRLTVDGKLLTDVEIVSIVRNWTAGVGTVAAGIGILLLHLATRQDLQQRLRAEPSVLPQAVDEILRVDGPLVANRRTTTREVEIDGRQIGQGQRISLMWIPADRDPRAFDDPEDVRLDRNEQGTVLFGDGIHYCQGAPLARLQMRIALEELLRQSRHIELSGAEPPSRVTFPSNGMLTLSLRIS
ncbi:MAG TPA: cytochrome P450, partial [Nitrolancea sp.]|nr:cytochrome P450 [Nitrolancea sp.]